MKKGQNNKFYIAILLLVGFSVLLIALAQFFHPNRSASGQLYGTFNCSWNIGCCPDEVAGPNTLVEYLSCPDSVSCGDSLCTSNGTGCSFIANNDCSTNECHPTYCTATCGLGGCPGGCGSQDDCGGVSCSTCPGGTTCGDDFCNGGETCGTCPGDCGVCGGGGSVCGDGSCTGAETCSTCSGDCGACGGSGSPVCGDGACGSGETCSSCSGDCGSCTGGEYCGDGSCDPTESCSICNADCGGCNPGICGNGTCESGETGSSCPADCPASCGNGICNLTEDDSTCPADCTPSCGNGSCDGTETATGCPVDCGPGICGNGSCEIGETVGNCTTDCCGSGTSTIRARGVVVPLSDISRTAAESSTVFVDITVTLIPSCDSPQVASGGSYATFSNYPGGTYTISATAPAGYVLQAGYWGNTVPGAQGTGLTAAVGTGGTLTWTLAYTAGTPWVQAQGGDVYATNNISSPIAAGAASRFFVTDGASGSPGVVTYGASYDFDSAAGAQGEAYVSSDGWLANDTFPQTDYYAVMYHRFGSPAATSTGNTTYTSERPTGTYFVDGNLTINTADWNVTNGESIVVFVDGNLTINRRINLSGTGFVSFIVNGNITVSPTVGVAYTSSTPVVEGVYITSPTGSISTGTSTNVGTQRFVGEGIFVTGDFVLQRDLDSIAQNNSTSGELFIYNPQLLVSMPDEMNDVPISWQEVAP